jgi:hypothetical protein
MSPGRGAGLTFNLPGGVSGFGETVFSPVASGTSGVATAELDLYNNTTLLGSVFQTSDSDADPFFIGAADSNGSEITSATLKLTQITVNSIGVCCRTYPNESGYVFVSSNGLFTGISLRYNPNENHIDPVFCSTITDFTNLENLGQCPQSAQGHLGVDGNVIDWHNGLAPYTATFPTPLTEAQITAAFGLDPGTPNGGPIDTDPGDLNNFMILNAVISGGTAQVQAVAPEPGTWLLLGLGLSGMGIIRRRKNLPH